MENKQKTFSELRGLVKEGDEETIHFIMTTARNISSFIIKENKRKGKTK